jgi:hypothetical protein
MRRRSPEHEPPRRQMAEARNLLTAIESGRDRRGLTYRLVELTDETRLRGGRESRRRRTRVWRPVVLEQSEND